MKRMTKTSDRLFVWGGVLAAFLWMAGFASAQNVPVQVVCKTPVLDEFGQVLANEPGDLIQILFVNGQVYPPAVTGEPNVNNGVAYTTYMGYGVLRETMLGCFSASVNPTPADNTLVIARVFNAPTLQEASFYTDSQVFTTYQGRVFYPVFTATTNAIDPNDDDGDGLNNSWEKSLGTSSALADSDGDGMNDYHEFLAGTGGMNADEVLQMVRLMPGEADVLHVEWDSVPGKRYQLQVADPELGTDAFDFVDVNETVDASAGAVTYTTVTNVPVGRLFRIKLAP